MPKHILEQTYDLSASELLDAIANRFRLRVAVEGAVAEFQMEKLLRATGLRYESHDLDGHADFSIWLHKRSEPLLAECKNIRESGRAGGEAYRQNGKIVAYKVETQKTRASTADSSSRFYDLTKFHILGVCLGKKTSAWSDFMFARTVDLERHKSHPNKLAVMQRVPLPEASEIAPWYRDLNTLLQHIDDPPWHSNPSTKRR